MEQGNLFGFTDKDKTYRALRHDVVRNRQNSNEDVLHHPNQKIKQVRDVLKRYYLEEDLSVLELFSGRGNLTGVYEDYGDVDAYDKKWLNTGDSYKVFHRLIGEGKSYDIIDLDPYGFPNRFFPDIFLLIENGFMFITMPKPYVNILNGITKTHLECYYGKSNPSDIEIIERIATFALCHWRKIELINSMNLKSVWRFAFKVEKVKATEYTGVKNR